MGHSPPTPVQYDEPAPYWRNRDVWLLAVAFAAINLSASLSLLETATLRSADAVSAASLRADVFYTLTASVVAVGGSLVVWLYGDCVDRRRLAASVFAGTAALYAVIGIPIVVAGSAASSLLGLFWYPRSLSRAASPLLAVLLRESVRPSQVISGIAFATVAGEVLGVVGSTLAALTVEMYSPLLLSLVAAAVVALAGVAVLGIRFRQPQAEEPYGGIFGALPLLVIPPRVLLGAAILGATVVLLRLPPGLFDDFRQRSTFSEYANAQLGRDLAPLVVLLVSLVVGSTAHPGRVALLVTGGTALAMGLLGSFGLPTSTLHYAVILAARSALPDLALTGSRGVVLLAAPPQARVRVLMWVDTLIGLAALVVVWVGFALSGVGFGPYAVFAGASGLGLVVCVALGFPALRRFSVAARPEVLEPLGGPPDEAPPPAPPPSAPSPGLGFPGRGTVGR